MEINILILIPVSWPLGPQAPAVPRTAGPRIVRGRSRRARGCRWRGCGGRPARTRQYAGSCPAWVHLGTCHKKSFMYRGTTLCTVDFCSHFSTFLGPWNRTRLTARCKFSLDVQGPYIQGPRKGFARIKIITHGAVYVNTTSINSYYITSLRNNSRLLIN